MTFKIIRTKVILTVQNGFVNLNYNLPIKTKSMKYLYIATLILLVSCRQSNNHSDKNEAANSDTLSKTSEIITEKTISLTDKTVKFLWRDSNNSIVINHEFCKTISAPEKAALGYVATFIGNECWWDGDYTDKRDHLKCEILTALDLGYQCSDKHLGFLKQWFKNDQAALNELEACPTIPNTSTIQDTFDEIILTTKGNEIIVFFKANGLNMREGKTWNWTQTNYFQLDNDNIKLMKEDKSNLMFEQFGDSEK